MPEYRRLRVPGGTYFFTVNLRVRGSRLLLEHIDALRQAVATVRQRQPFHIDAWVVLPDHMHCIWTLPDGDVAYPNRWYAIKARFSRSIPPTEPAPPPCSPAASGAYGNAAVGNMPSATTAMTPTIGITFTSTRSNKDLQPPRATGPTPPANTASAAASPHTTGAAPILARWDLCAWVDCTNAGESSIG